jgi:outer membrane protein assembly factor BamB
MTPVCYEGYIYALCGDSTTFLTTPLACIELSTGTVRWTTNRFGLGGIILVNTNLLVLTEDGQLVLVRPNPTAYTELARYRAFQFTTSAPGKCWNSPAYSDGRIYARSTRDAVSLNVAPPVPPQLKILSAQFLDRAHLQLVVGTTNGAPIDTARLARLEVRATNALGAPPNTWPLLNDALTLATNGAVWLTNAVGDEFRRFYIISEPP